MQGVTGAGGGGGVWEGSGTGGCKWSAGFRGWVGAGLREVLGDLRHLGEKVGLYPGGH